MNAESLHLRFIGAKPIVLTYAAGNGLTVEVEIGRDLTAWPFWLGQWAAGPGGRTVRVRKRWFIPHIPVRDQQAALASQYGPKRARKLVHDRLEEDARRLMDYGKGWFLYRMAVTVMRDGEILGSEEMQGLSEYSLPITGKTDLVERLAADILRQAT